MQTRTQNKWIGYATIGSAVIAFASLLATMMAVNYNAEALANPVLVLSLPGVKVSLTKWAMLFDMFGYYLLLLPLIFLLRQQLGSDRLLSKLSGFCGVAYVMVGAIGAAVLAVVWPNLITAYGHADAQAKIVLATNFNGFNLMVYEGMWNLLEMIFAAAWWIILGVLFYRKGSALFGILTGLLGLSCAANSLSVMFDIKSLHAAALNIYLLFSIVWTLFMGIFILRGKSLLVTKNVASFVTRKATASFSNS